MSELFTKIKPFKFYCQKILPLVYDDSLSYYEVLCKIRHILNQLIENNNNLPEFILELIRYELPKALVEIEKEIVPLNDSEGDIATEDRSIGQVLWWKHKLYVVTQDIPKNGAYVEGTNIVHTTVEEMINKIKDSVISAIAQINSELGEQGADINELRISINQILGDYNNVEEDINNIYNILDTIPSVNKYPKYFLSQYVDSDNSNIDEILIDYCINNPNCPLYIDKFNYIITDNIDISMYNVQLHFIGGTISRPSTITDGGWRSIKCKNIIAPRYLLTLKNVWFNLTDKSCVSYPEWYGGNIRQDGTIDYGVSLYYCMSGSDICELNGYYNVYDHIYMYTNKTLRSGSMSPNTATLSLHGYSIIGGDNATVEGITIYSDILINYSYPAIIIDDVSNCKIINCNINGFQEGIRIYKTKFTNISNCQINMDYRTQQEQENPYIAINVGYRNTPITIPELDTIVNDGNSNNLNLIIKDCYIQKGIIADEQNVIGINYVGYCGDTLIDNIFINNCDTGIILDGLNYEQWSKGFNNINITKCSINNYVDNGIVLMNMVNNPNLTLTDNFTAPHVSNATYSSASFYIINVKGSLLLNNNIAFCGDTQLSLYGIVIVNSSGISSGTNVVGFYNPVMINNSNFIVTSDTIKLTKTTPICINIINSNWINVENMILSNSNTPLCTGEMVNVAGQCKWITVNTHRFQVDTQVDYTDGVVRYNGVLTKQPGESSDGYLFLSMLTKQFE